MDRQRDAQVEEKKKAGGREGGREDAPKRYFLSNPGQEVLRSALVS